MQIFEAVRKCPICGKDSMVTLFGTECEQYEKHSIYGKRIQEALPDTEAPVREFLRMTFNPKYEAYCHDCMKDVCGKTSDRIRPYIPVCENIGIDEDENDLTEETYNQYYEDLKSFDQQYRDAGLTCGGTVVITADYKDNGEVLFKGKLLKLIKNIGDRKE